MITLIRPSGKELTLMFNPDQSLATARFDGLDVTRTLRYLREHNHAMALAKLGFRKTYSEEVLRMWKELKHPMDQLGLEVFSVDPPEGVLGMTTLFICLKTDECLIAKILRARALVDVNTCELLHIKKKSNCPEDIHLEVLLAQ